MNEPLIVIVEDDVSIAELIEYNLQNNGYQTHRFGNGEAMLTALPGMAPVTLFILDVMLPGVDGFEILKQLKADAAHAAVPVLMLTARGSETDKVRGLVIGADDYITKPFGVREFLARVEALLRRYGSQVSRQAREAEKTADSDSELPLPIK